MKTRIKLRFFKSGSIVSSKFVVESLLDGRWGMFGDDDGIKKFDSREEAEAEAERLKAMLRKGGAK